MPMYDLCVIGAGWAGFNAALRAKESGLKVCLIECGQIGGTCLNQGCIPTKSLIACAKRYSLVKKSSGFGIEADNPRFNFNKIQEKKNNLIRLLAQGMQSRLSGIDFVASKAHIVTDHEIKVDGQIISTNFMLICTGSRAIELPQLKFDAARIISSDGALSLESLPHSLLIVGGGVIGCEFASLFSMLGVEVSIVEKMPLLLPGEDNEAARKIEVIFKKKGIKVHINADLSAVNLNDYEKVLVCVGRQPNISGLGLEGLGIKLGKTGIAVDDYLRTSLDNIYAAGDCTAKVMLAHYASYQGVVAVENIISGNKNKADNSVVPACVFCDPEIASVGLNEEKAIAAGLAVKVNKFDFRASAMARIIDEPEGFIKVVLDRKSKEIIGGCIVGPKATELIAVLTMAVSLRLKAEDVRKVIFAHPTLSESLRDAM
ncbi:MAG: dihydrolipoyl dehydrogenase [Candidatus Omnitrophica bacterium]|nr:dihydrolipoyl dehydrogenase [Candidatus Omnitrophota bacterium]